MSFVTWVLGIIVLALFMLVRIGRCPKKTKLLKPLPGPRGLPLIGSIFTIARYKKPWDAFSTFRKQYGDIYGVTLGSRQCVVISNLDLIKEVLVYKWGDFSNRPGFLRFDVVFRGDRNQSIAFCNWSEKQSTRRKITYPLLHPRPLTFDSRRMDNIIKSELQKLIASLSHSQNQTLEARSFLNRTCAHIFYQFICSKRFPDQDSMFLKAVRNYNVVFKKMFEGYATDFMPWLKIFSDYRLKELAILAEDIWKLTEAVVKEHAESINCDQPRDLVDTYLNYLKKTNTTLTLKDVEVLIEDLVGGHPVVGNMWLWGLYLVAANPEVQASIREEVNRVTGGNLRAPSLKDRASMPYTECTTLETLRVIISPVTPHVAVTDTSISGYRVIKDSIVFINVNDMNMDPQLWREPRKFRPQRFLSDSGSVSKPDYFIPFGTGKRTCLGDHLVKSTLFLGLSTLIQNFEISIPEDFPEPDMQDIPGIIVPRSEIRLIFKRIDQKL